MQSLILNSEILILNSWGLTADSRLPYNPPVPSRVQFILSAILLAALSAFAQTPDAAQPSGKPQVKVNVLNVCTPPEADLKEIAAALARIPTEPHLAADMEVSRGRSVSSANDIPDVLGTGKSGAQVKSESTTSNWVRVRYDLVEGSALTSAQYTFSVNQGEVSETLVFHFRETRPVLQVSLSDTVTASSNPLDVARSDTPADHVRLERFGKSSIVLARCVAADQSIYEVVFSQASKLMAAYRKALKVKLTVPGELEKLGIGQKKATTNKPPTAGKK